MISNVANIQQTSNSPNFKGKLRKTEKGNSYYHTNSAIKIGGSLAGLTTLGSGYEYFRTKLVETRIKEVPKDKIKVVTEAIKHNKKFAIISGVLGLAGHLGAAIYIDKKRNENAKKLADLDKNTDINTIMELKKDTMISQNDNVVPVSKVGAKKGGLLGAGIGLLFGIVSSIHSFGILKMGLEDSAEKIPNEIKTAFKNGSTKGAILLTALAAGVGSLAGWLLGKWSDNIANEDTFKNA